MANIKIELVQEYSCKIKNLKNTKKNISSKSLVIQFKKGDLKEDIIDDKMANTTLYLQSRNGPIVINCDESGLIVAITIQPTSLRIKKQCLVPNIITVEQIQKYTDSLYNWPEIGESPARECLVIQFKKEKRKSTKKNNVILQTKEIVFDLKKINDYLINNTLYLQSRNGNVSIDFDESGLIVGIEIV